MPNDSVSLLLILDTVTITGRYTELSCMSHVWSPSQCPGSLGKASCPYSSLVASSLGHTCRHGTVEMPPAASEPTRAWRSSPSRTGRSSMQKGTHRAGTPVRHLLYFTFSFFLFFSLSNSYTMHHVCDQTFFKETFAFIMLM